MSAVSTRRLRDPNAVTAAPRTTAQKLPKNLSPLSIPSLQKSASGKENPRPSGTAQKPLIRPVPRVEKAALGFGGRDGEARARWSTSTAPRGRSSSPSEFIRVFSELRREKGSRVSADKSWQSVAKEKIWNRNSVVNTNESGTRNCKETGGFSDDFVKSTSFPEGLDKESERNINSSADLVNGTACKGSKEKGGLGFASNLESRANVDRGCHKKTGFLSKSDGKVEQVGKGVDLGLRRTSLDGNGRVLEISKGTGVNEDGVSSWVSNKYQTKLHEKLAFLEGKVKRIASDIKKTKEMLDMNNPDASKMILSDIQEKISGIEKAMGNVVSNSGGKLGVLTSSVSDNREVKIAGKNETNQVEHVKSSVNGLNSEELEARLFPHHKLLRGRTSLQAFSGGSQSLQLPDVTEPSRDVNVEVKPLSPSEENPIALEFLASLDKEHTKVTVRSEQVHMAHGEVQEMDGDAVSRKQDSSNMLSGNADLDLILKTDERLDDFDQENKQAIMTDEETDDPCVYQLNEISSKTSTGGWFVSEGEAVLLAHDDGSCSFYDVANCEEKAVYSPPLGISPNIWRDCWIIRASGADGCSGRYVVAASAGNTLDSGFCSWDFYTKDVCAFHIEERGTTTSRTVLGPLPNNPMHRRNTLTSTLIPETQQWWYKPCGPLIISTASSQSAVKVFDIRDGEKVMNWELQKPVLTMDYSSPLQWRNRGKVVIAEVETISVWDVSSLNAQPLLSVSSSDRKISALHVNNTDAELGGGVRLRATSSEAEGNDGVFCIPDSINILDFRHPSGIGAKIPKLCVNVHSISSRGDSIFLGCSNARSAGKKQLLSQVQQYSLRKQRLLSTYSLPESDAHLHHSAITQVWGNSNLVMAVCGLGLFVFDALGDDSLQPFASDCGSFQRVKEIIGPDDMYSPSFDYLGSRVLLISRDRPAQCRHLL